MAIRPEIGFLAEIGLVNYRNNICLSPAEYRFGDCIAWIESVLDASCDRKHKERLPWPEKSN